MIVMQKDNRRAKTKIEIEVGKDPSPILQINCLSEKSCFPGDGGVFINPNSRLGIVGECVSHCKGDLSYEWTITNKEHPLETVS